MTQNQLKQQEIHYYIKYAHSSHKPPAEPSEPTAEEPMSNELVAYKPPPPPIPKSTLKKEELNIRERLWVWNDLICMGGGGISAAIGIAWISIPLTMQAIGDLFLGGGMATAITSIIVFCERAFDGKTALASAAITRYPLARLSHDQRAELCRMDRNRRARPHRGNFKFAPRLYSVWPIYTSFTGHGKGLHLVMLEHVRPRPYLLCYLLPRRLRFSQRAWWVKISDVPDMSAPEDAQEVQIKRGIINLGARPEEEKVTATFERLEQLALAMEEKPHQEKVSEFQAEEMALNLRRQPPKMRTETIQKTRRLLK